MKRHIAIIEDDEDLLTIMTMVLKSQGYRVSAYYKVGAIDELLELQPDIFVIDETLPGITGHILCIILKSKPQTAHIPIVLVSGHPELDHYATLCNADHFLTKPFELERLVKLLDNLKCA
jgi:DNA-binding response OmpR family regulator